jgi:tRNA U34 5-carboxymethylaminomethyl modifying GTPase MnmE/TrmE
MANKKIPQHFEKVPPTRENCLYLDQFQYDVLNNCSGAIEGIVEAMRPHDEVAGLAEALHLAWDKITDILGELEGQKVSRFCGGAK